MTIILRAHSSVVLQPKLTTGCPSYNRANYLTCMGGMWTELFFWQIQADLPFALVAPGQV